jgi:hypothetical protein
MPKVVKCFHCKTIIEYNSTYENNDKTFLLDKEKSFVGWLKENKIECVGCMNGKGR